MKLLKRLTALCLTATMAFSVSACGYDRDKTAKDLSIENYVTIQVWYDNDSYTQYLNQVASGFHSANELVTIKPVLVGSEDYMSNIYNESVQNKNVADIYLMSSDDMQKAYMMGLTTENNAYDSVYNEKIYGKAGIQSASYNNKLYGYPVSFNTSYLVYNKKYVSGVDTFQQLEDYCNSYEVTDENQDVSVIATWDVSSMFLNYGFASNEIEISNSDQDKTATCKVTADGVRIKDVMKDYFGLKEKLGIDRNEVTMQSCIDLFKEGKLLYTILDANSLSQISDSGVDYGIANVPNLSEDHITHALSETTLAMVNPYTQSLEAARAVAKAISYDYADQLTSKSGLQSARSDLKYKDQKDAMKALHDIYGESVTKSGMIGADELYLRYEIMIHQIWDGMSVDDAYNIFQQYLDKMK